jgi:3-oxoacyl-[acyl-carrier protein] reductase
MFAAEGAKVLAVDLEPFTLEHENIQTLAQDVSADIAAAAITGGAVERFGKLDILMNNAGIGGGAPIAEFPDELWEKNLAVNLTPHFKLSKAAIPRLKESGAGRIINVASVMAEGTDYGLAAYSAAKAGVAGLTRNLALELGRFGITANYILPGAIRTGMTVNFKDPKIAEIWAKKSPLKRLGEPIDLARGALFLASDDGGFVTGHGLNVDGGLMLRV